MKISDIVQSIDLLISRLQQARDLLQDVEVPSQLTNSISSKGRSITPEGRRKIAAAQRARWIKVKEAMKS